MKSNGYYERRHINFEIMNDKENCLYENTFSTADRRTLKTQYIMEGAARNGKKDSKIQQRMDITDYQFEPLARGLLLKIQKYYESEEGKRI